MDNRKVIDEILELALASTDVSDLIPEDLEPVLVDIAKRLTPLTSKMLINVGEADGKTHEFNQVTAGSTAEFEGEAAVTRQRSFTTNRVSRQCKIIRASDGVTHFAQSATRKQIDLYKEALERGAKAMKWAMEFAWIWGWGKDTSSPKDGDIYMYGGADQNITTNLIDHGSAKVTLDLLDEMIDETLYAGMDEGTLLFLMDPRMQSVVSALQTRIEKQVSTVEFPGGFRMKTYRDVPIMKTGYNRPFGTMGTITGAKDATVGLLEAKTYRYKVSYVSQRGESAHAPSIAVAADADDSIKLSWTAVADAELYKIYRSIGDGGAGTEKLLVVIPAKAYDGSGTVSGTTIASYMDGLADASIGAQIPLTSVDHTIHLLNLDPVNSLQLFALVNKEGEAIDNLIQYFELAKVKSAKNFDLESFQIAAWKGEKYNSYARRVKLE